MTAHRKYSRITLRYLRDGARKGVALRAGLFYYRKLSVSIKKHKKIESVPILSKTAEKQVFYLNFYKVFDPDQIFERATNLQYTHAGLDQRDL